MDSFTRVNIAFNAIFSKQILFASIFLSGFKS